jgi:hypothetical protein
MRYTCMFFTLLALAGTSTATRAQTVSGRLLDAATAQPIAAGTMALLSDGTAVATVVTDTAGRFVLNAGRSGSYRLRAERIGYRTAETLPLDLTEGDTVMVEFRLSVDAVAMNPITVTGHSRRPAGQLGGFYDRMRSGIGGAFITREEIEERRPIDTTDLLRTIPGVFVTAGARGGTIVRVRGDCSPRVFLDGLPIQLMGMSIDNLVRPMDLEGIEVYRGPAELPAQFAHGACGAIVLWTRRGP